MCHGATLDIRSGSAAFGSQEDWNCRLGIKNMLSVQTAALENVETIQRGLIRQCREGGVAGRDMLRVCKSRGSTRMAGFSRASGNAVVGTVRGVDEHAVDRSTIWLVVGQVQHRDKQRACQRDLRTISLGKAHKLRG